VILISCLVILVALIPNTRNRFLELINISNDKENAQSSTNIRYTIYKNSFKLVKNAPLLGYGIGDYNLVLKESYKKNAPFLLKKQYNSHNQYLSFFLMGGFCLFLIFIFTYTKNIFLSIKEGNTMLILLLTFYGIMMLFENILERENGVIFFAFFINFFALKNYYNIEE
jgi:O-antigen ligase